MKCLKLNLPTYPFMAGIVPVLLYYNTQAATEIPVDALLIPCAAVIAATIAVYILPCLSVKLYGALLSCLAHSERLAVSTPDPPAFPECLAPASYVTVSKLEPAEHESHADPSTELDQIWALWAALGWTMFFSLSFCIELNGLCRALNVDNFSVFAMADILPYLFLLIIALAVIPLFIRDWLPRITSAMHQAFLLILLVQLACTTWYVVRSELLIKPAVESIQRTEILNVALKNNDQSVRLNQAPSEVLHASVLNETAPRTSHVQPSSEIKPAELSTTPPPEPTVRMWSKPTAEAVQTAAVLNRARRMQPDIYYIVLDEMASSDVLARYVNYDDDWFRKALEDRGFFVTRNSLSNYPLTRLSISSSLNMTYLDKYVAINGKDSNELMPTAVLMRNSAVAQVLKKQDYEYIHIDSAVPPTNHSYLADRVIHCGFIDQFSDKLMRSTLAALSPQAMAWLRQHARETILNQFAAPGKVSADANRSKSVFVFSHILCPHEPFLFDLDGKPVFDEGSRSGTHWNDGTVAAYAAQTKFAQRKTIASVDAILEQARKTRRMPLIILQGDHGTHSSDYVSSAHPGRELLQERYGILNAYLVPDDIRKQLNDETEPVNSFRIVLRTLFDLDLPNLEERQIYATYERVFDFRDVSAQVRKHKACHSSTNALFVRPLSEPRLDLQNKYCSDFEGDRSLRSP